MEKDKEWSNYYNYWEKTRYKIGNITFINNRRTHPCRSYFANWVINTSSVGSVLEAGPGEMVEYQLILVKRPNIKYSILDVSDMFIENCRSKYPGVDTYQIPLERLDIFDKGQFDCVFQSSVFEHSPDVCSAIKNFMYVGKHFHFVFFKWDYEGDLSVYYNKKKKVCSSCFNVWKIIEEVEKYGEIEYASIIMNRTNEVISFDEFSKGKSGKWRSGDYLMLHGKQK